MISVDAYLFLAFSDLEDTGISVFRLHCVLCDSKETELGSSDQEASPSVGENTGVVLVPCFCAWKCIPTAISSGVDISEVPGCHLLQQMSSQ